MRTTHLVIAIISFLVLGCKNCPDISAYNPPKSLNDGILVGTLNDVKIDSTKILEAINNIQCDTYGEVHSMLIFKDNQLVLERYFQGHKYQWDGPKYFGDLVQWDSKTPHHIMSCTKSFTSACIGIAVDKGFIKDVNQSIFDYLPDHQQFKKDGKQDITIEHLLTMSSGLAWNEWNAAHGTSANDIDRIYFECSNDPIKCVLERKLEKKPGKHFNYNGGGMIILGEILKNATKMNINDFSMKYLFDPLGIESTSWYQFDNGSYASAGSLELTSRDMLKFGVLYFK